MNEIPFDWDDLRLFVSVARHGGLAGAATETGKSAPTLGRRVLALEQRLKRDLFERSSRGYTLTSDGQSLLSLALELESNISPLLSDSSQEEVPRVKISAGSWITYYLCSHAGHWLNKQWQPVRFISANHHLDISHREAAIGIRNTRPTNNNLAGQPLKRIKFAIYAQQSSIDIWARVVGNTPSAQWVHEHYSNLPCIEVTDPRNVLDLLSAGAARAVLPTIIGDAEPGLEKISDDINALEHQQWLVTHHEDRHRPEVRQVINWIADVLGDDQLLR